MKHSHLHVGAECFNMHNVVSNMQGTGGGWTGIAHGGGRAMQQTCNCSGASEDITAASSTAADLLRDRWQVTKASPFPALGTYTPCVCIVLGEVGWAVLGNC